MYLRVNIYFVLVIKIGYIVNILYYVVLIMNLIVFYLKKVFFSG